MIIEKGGDDPLAGDKITKEELIPNKKLKAAIEDFKRVYPFAEEEEISEKELFLNNL